MYELKNIQTHTALITRQNPISKGEAWSYISRTQWLKITLDDKIGEVYDYDRIIQQASWAYYSSVSYVIPFALRLLANSIMRFYGFWAGKNILFLKPTNRLFYPMFFICFIGFLNT
jgi:hypothetical protein